MSLKYPQEFINEVKELYPDYKEIHKLADEHAYFLGRYLDDSSGRGVPYDTVLTATSLDELQKYARNEKRKVQLYRQWSIIIDLHHKTEVL
jgi:hypothetical protein